MKSEHKDFSLGSYLVGIVIGILIVVGFIYIFPQQPKIVEKNVTVEQPLIMFALSDWAENSDKPSETLFRGYVYNFGTVEVKDIQLTCRTYNEDIVLDSYTEMIGNLGSLSDKYIEVSHPMKDEVEGVTGLCAVTNMSSGINLFSRLPDYKKYYS